MAIDKIQSESINLADNFAFTGTVTGAGGVNTPAFQGYYSSSYQTVSDNTDTKLTIDTEEFDTDSAIDTSTYRFTVPSGKAGKYFFPGCSDTFNLNFAGLYMDVDGSFPNHPADPSDVNNLSDLKDKVISENLDFGVAFEGDEDRSVFIDNKGNLISG